MEQSTQNNSLARNKELILKLLVLHHLSVPERQELPEQKIYFSVCVELAQEMLAKDNWFPRVIDWIEIGKQYAGEFSAIELTKENTLILHHYADAEALRTTDQNKLHSKKYFTDLTEVVHEYLLAEKNCLDDIEIYWKE